MNWDKSRKLLIDNREKILRVLMLIIIMIVGRYRMSELTMPIILDDEFGYWSNAMWMLGKDWSPITNHLGYYSYGYSFLLCIAYAIRNLTGYGADYMYQVATMINVVCLMVSFHIATIIGKRYLKHMGEVAIDCVCLMAVLYPSNLVYSHTTLTECTLTLVFWCFAYAMMRCIEQATVWNHIALAVFTIYSYTVHQRTIGLILVSFMMVYVLNILHKNNLRCVVAHNVTCYVGYVLATVIKKQLQRSNYLGSQREPFGSIFREVLNGKSLLMLLLLAAVVFLLWCIGRKWYRVAAGCMVAGIVAGVIGLTVAGDALLAGGSEDARMAVNDLSGQLGVFRNLFTKHGLIRIGTSIVGKWYYLAAATGLMICFGLIDMLVAACLMLTDLVRRVICIFTHKEHHLSKRMDGDLNACIFKTGMFLSFAGAFMICALYKEGLYKVDDLINGRYIEYLIGIVLLYSVDEIMKQKYWYVSWGVFLGAYLAAGAYCQYVFDLLQRTEYELIHAVVFGRIFWNYQSPTGKIAEVAQYVIPLSIAFFLLVKCLSVEKCNTKVRQIRLIFSLIIPIMVWSHIYTEIVDNYVVVRNEKQSGAAPTVAKWIVNLSGDRDVYFVSDGLSYKQAELIQYMAWSKDISYTSMEACDFTQDAAYVIANSYLTDDRITERCELVESIGSYAVVVNKDGETMKLWENYKHMTEGRQDVIYIDENED